MKKRGVFKTITDIIGYTVIIALVVLSGFIIISKASGRIFFIGGKATMWVMTPSMEPVIPEKSYILVEKVTAEDVKENDIIVFISDDPAIRGQYNTHRIIGVTDGGFITKGDNNAVQDQYPARSENVVGRYVQNLDLLSQFGRFLSSRMGLVSMICLILAITMGMFLPEMRRLRAQQDAQAEKQHEAVIDELVRQEVERLKKQHEEELKNAENDKLNDNTPENH